MESLSITTILSILEEYGFDLVTFWAHAFVHNECDTTDLKMSSKLHGLYSSCWYGADFLNLLLARTLTPLA